MFNIFYILRMIIGRFGRINVRIILLGIAYRVNAAVFRPVVCRFSLSESFSV